MAKHEEWLLEVKRQLTIKRWNHSFKPNEWFFPSDVIPHSTQFKYRCKKLYEAGLLERSESHGRWGWRYRVPSE